MAAAVTVWVDDLPDFILEGFGDHRLRYGAYPRVLLVSTLLGDLMKARPGVWRPVQGFGGVWAWVRNLAPGDVRGMDEFGRPD